MALYSLNHASIGRATHAPGTAGAHIAYIARPGARAELLAERMPGQAAEARAWLDQAEATERKNGRVVDKIRLALPLELSAEQRAAAVRDFAGRATQGRAPWLAAIHDQGKDAGNPHCHLVIRDKDPETGKRVAQLSEKGSTERLRELWEQVANEHLARAQVAARIDRRTLAAQGIDRAPTIHVGPKVQAMEAKPRPRRPVSQVRQDHRGRDVRWPEIDAGRTRSERNREIIAANQARAMEAAREAAQKAQEEAADRYASLLQRVQWADAAAHRAAIGRQQWERDHPWRTRLHRLGLKAGPLAGLDQRIAGAAEAHRQLGQDSEGRAAWEAREEARERAEADRKVQEEAKRQAEEIEAQRRRQVAEEEGVRLWREREARAAAEAKAAAAEAKAAAARREEAREAQRAYRASPRGMAEERERQEWHRQQEEAERRIFGNWGREPPKAVQEPARAPQRPQEAPERVQHPSEYQTLPQAPEDPMAALNQALDAAHRATTPVDRKAAEAEIKTRVREIRKSPDLMRRCEKEDPELAGIVNKIGRAMEMQKRQEMDFEM